MHDEHVKKTQQEKRPIPLDRQSRQRRGQAFELLDEDDYRVDPRAGWRFFNSESQGTPSHSSSSTKWDLDNGRREVGILGILRGLTIREFSQSLGPVSAAGR